MKLFSFGKKSRTPAEFWSWFVAHQQDYAAGQPSSSAIHALGEAINSVHNGLAWGISLGGDDRTPTLEISADGIRDHIRPVLQLVRSAPPIPGWNVVAFRQPMSDMALAIGDEKIDQDSVLVATKSAGPGVLDVALFLPLPSMVPKEDYTKIGFLMLDHAVGEYRVMTQIGTVQFLHITVAPPGSPMLRQLLPQLEAIEPELPPQLRLQ